MESNLQKRLLLFLVGCMSARLYLSRVLYNIEIGTIETIIGSKLTKVISIVIGIIGVGFWYIYTNDLRKTGVEVFGDKIWWNDMRPFHGSMYLLAGITLMSVDHRHYAWKLILVDTMVGLIKFLEHHFG
jgi:hypothetical protein